MLVVLNHRDVSGIAALTAVKKAISQQTMEGKVQATRNSSKPNTSTINPKLSVSVIIHIQCIYPHVCNSLPYTSYQYSYQEHLASQSAYVAGNCHMLSLTEMLQDN